MSDFILIDGDSVLFQCNCGLAIVSIKPGKIKGTGDGTLNGKKLCIDGDEKSVEVKDCMYITPMYPIPGKGTLKIDALAGDQKAQKTQTSGKPVLLKGKFFTSKFEVATAAKEAPQPPKPQLSDTMTSYSGQGQFLTNNKKFKGT